MMPAKDVGLYKTLNTLKVKQPQVEINKYASRDYNSDKNI